MKGKKDLECGHEFRRRETDMGTDDEGKEET